MPQQFCGFAYGQAHDTGITAIEARHKHRTQALNGVSASFVLRFSAGPLKARFLFTDVSKFHTTAHHTGLAELAINDCNGR